MELSDALLHVGLRDVKFERCYGMRRTGNMEMKGKLVDTVVVLQGRWFNRRGWGLMLLKLLG
jgi:hypothetical protein